MRLSLLIAVLSAGMGVSTLRLPERSLSEASRGEAISRVTSATGGLAVIKLQRAQSRHPIAKVGPFVLPALVALPRPAVHRVTFTAHVQEGVGRGPSTTHGARGPPASLPV